MRKIFALFLLLLISLQATWAAVSPYCQHETGMVAKHFGHHEHQHKLNDGKKTASDLTNRGGADLDCATCLVGSFCAAIDLIVFAKENKTNLDQSCYEVYFSSPPSGRPERPQWLPLA